MGRREREGIRRELARDNELQERAWKMKKKDEDEKQKTENESEETEIRKEKER